MADETKDIKEMIDGFLGDLPEPTIVEPVVEPIVEPVVEPVVKPVIEPVVEPVVEPIVEPVVESVVATPDPRVAAPAAPAEPAPEPTETERLREQNRLLIERLEKVSGPAPVEPAAPTAAPVPEPALPTPAPARAPTLTVEEVDFLVGEDPEKLAEDPVAFNRLLNKIYAKAVEQAIPLAAERTMLNIPSLVVQHVRQQSAMNKLVDDFYSTNSDLVPVKRSVGLISNEVHAENPDWTVEKVFTEAATRTRTLLGMPQPAIKNDPTPPVVAPGAPVAPGSPAFAEPAGSRPSGPQRKLTGMAKEIDDILP